VHQPGDTFSAGGIYVLGEALFSKYLLPFEVASLLLLVALIGTVYLAKRKI
jgi:NADH-quinone oxidoreductase subunit J